MRWTWIASVAAVLALAVVGLATYEHMLGPVSRSSRSVIVVVPAGSGVSQIGRDLESRGLIRNATAFGLLLRAQGRDRAVKAGVYAVSPRLGAWGIADRLFAGEGESARVTVPEGFSIRQIASLLDERAAGSGSRFAAAAADPSRFREQFPWLAALPAGATLEGFLFPDTYHLAPAPGWEAEVIRLMLARFEQVARPRVEAVRGLSAFEAVTLASIVEKEARLPGERPTIAGVFLNRLAARMPFGSDPTVEYALGRHQGARGLSFRDVAVESRYNTYKYAGLPPGPIANPGLASLDAVLAPAKTDLLYFVARGDGSHVFTRTYREHLAAQKRIWAARKKD